MPLVRAVPLRPHYQVDVEWSASARSKTEPRAQPIMTEAGYGEAEPSPHSGRQSRIAVVQLFGDHYTTESRAHGGCTEKSCAPTRYREVTLDFMPVQSYLMNWPNGPFGLMNGLSFEYENR